MHVGLLSSRESEGTLPPRQVTSDETPKPLARLGRAAAARLLVILPILGCGALAACSRDPNASRAPVFGGVPKLQNNVVFQLARQGAEDKAKELGAELRWKAPREADAIEQRNIVYSLIEQKVDGIFLSVNNPTVLQKAIDDAVAAGIPVMCFDSDAPESKRFTCYAVDDVKSGARGADLLVEKMGKAGKVGILHGTAGAPNLEKAHPGLPRPDAGDRPRRDVPRAGLLRRQHTKSHRGGEERDPGNPDLAGFYMSGGWPLFAAPPGPFLGSSRVRSPWWRSTGYPRARLRSPRIRPRAHGAALRRLGSEACGFCGNGGRASATSQLSSTRATTS